MSIIPCSLTESEIKELTLAVEELESGRGVLLRLADIMGGAVGQALKLGSHTLGFSKKWQTQFQNIADIAVQQAFSIAITHMPNAVKVQKNRKYRKFHKKALQAMVVASGALGGFTGIAGTLPDIGFTTLALMREIARIAQEEGENLENEEVRRACLEVFALRPFGYNNQNDNNEMDFFSARLMLRGRPMILLMADVSYQYGLSLSQKLSMQMIPVVSALCGASLNAAFLSHYQALARVHFIARRLERQHGPLAKKTIQSICKYENQADSSFN
ncbi:hypothetical protein COMNV_00906 [Commensalibacter sp. Nvir]|uniref:EcsC family protein n=1 Tax=Commensalibacter sp. Nvir TaxID=3069817 RepID=UPI002D489A3E|nr:hypothetical protein COMNV_00906 [Commensalibacter sp. Nvir]